MKPSALVDRLFPRIASCLLSIASLLVQSTDVRGNGNRVDRIAPEEADTQSFSIPRGKPIKVDGRVEFNEWRDAATTEIAVSPTWKSRDSFKHDDRFLYFLFTGVRHGSERLFPEILLDPKFRRTETWEKGQWWFHISGNLCEGDGEPNVYNRVGVFQCSHEKPGWDGNNPPGPGTDVIEIRISFVKVGIDPDFDRKLGVALGLTNATGDARQKWYFSPPNATVGHPATWGTGVLE
jgi:hypothetical protein